MRSGKSSCTCTSALARSHALWKRGVAVGTSNQSHLFWRLPASGSASKQQMLLLAIWVVVVCGMLLAGPVLAQNGFTPTAADLEAGKQLYTEHCMHCHGENGDGKGASAAVVSPKPRDFTSGTYKFRTRHENANGNKMAADEDIFRSINDGLHGTSMPAWGGFLAKPQIWQLVHYVKTFASVFKEDQPGT